MISQSVHSLSCVQLFATPWTAARQATLPITISWCLLKPMSKWEVLGLFGPAVRAPGATLRRSRGAGLGALGLGCAGVDGVGLKKTFSGALAERTGCS